jgi:hypothetical protein
MELDLNTMTINGKKIWFNDNGHAYVTLDGKKYKASRLIHDAYVFDSEGRGYIQHLDGNPRNLNPDNLRLVSAKVIGKLAAKSRKFSGRAISHSKEGEIKILSRIYPAKKLAKQYGCSTRTIRRYAKCSSTAT